MKKSTNIYVLLDCSEHMQGRPIQKAQQMAIKYIRALSFSKANAKIQFIGYNENGFIFNPHTQLLAHGKPNIGEGLKQLFYLLARNENNSAITRSVCLLLTSGIVMQNWSHPLKMLFTKKEFAFAVRYVITYGRTDGISMRAFNAFTDTQERILPYFSDSRLRSLAESFNKTKA